MNGIPGCTVFQGTVFRGFTVITLRSRNLIAIISKHYILKPKIYLLLYQQQDHCINDRPTSYINNKSTISTTDPLFQKQAHCLNHHGSAGATQGWPLPTQGWPLPTLVLKMATLGEAKGGHLARLRFCPKF